MVSSKLEHNELPICPACGMSMRFARAVASIGLADLHSFQCDLCGVVLTGEAVTEAQNMAGPVPPVDLAGNLQHAQGYDPERIKELVDRMSTLRLRWLASVDNAAAGRMPTARLSHRLTQSKNWAAGYRSSASPPRPSDSDPDKSEE